MKKKFEIQKIKKNIGRDHKRKVDTFCYPYGGKNTYDEETIQLLRKSGYKYSFCVKNKDFNLNLQKNKFFELPRYDCNRFI